VFKLKAFLLKLWSIESHIRVSIGVSKFCYRRIPFLGRPLSMILDRLLLISYGVDLSSDSINVHALSISHPSGVLLGGNGIYSNGRVVIMSGVKFGGRKPNDPEYLAKHKEQKVFELGDNVVFGTNTVVLGPISICDNVIIASMSLVNRSINEPGVYAGVPAKKVSGNVDTSWVTHLN
jgi:serine acetyltransferase